MVACYERASSPAADEGTHMHLVMAARIAGTTEPSCTSEQQEVAKIAMEMLRQCAWREGIACHVEERMAWYDMLGNEFCAGTPDLWWVDEEGTGHLVDWKFGTQPVPATNDLRCHWSARGQNSRHHAASWNRCALMVGG